MKHLFLNCLAKTQYHLITIASLLKQDTHCAQILLQLEPLLKGKGEPGGEECNSKLSLFISSDTSIRFKWNHTANFPQANFTRENCFEDACLLREAKWSSWISRECRHSFTHRLLSFLTCQFAFFHGPKCMTMPSTSPL